MPINKIVLIGAGRVATQIGKVFQKHGKNISQIYSRTPESAKDLAVMLGALPINDLTKIDHNADLYIISVSDDSIAGIATHLYLPGKIVVHTSGSVDMTAIQSISEKCGVFYPLNIFSKSHETDFSTTPVCIEAQDKETEDELTELARTISGDVRLISSQQRAVIHLAAVFACNFTNFMMVNADDILQRAGIDFDILLPLITETIAKLRGTSPALAQTGPALRNDFNVIRKHIEMLNHDPGKQLMYELISKQINDYFTTK
ncbi:MAG: DUF2520 domain-containing protein [Bacteroidales bacterium]|nr:DUF2520 domain-containing protein [Bacteroidales bacterium]